MFDMTERVAEAWSFYDKLLDERLDHIAELSGVDREKLIKINPAEFIEKSKFQVIRGYQYRNIRDWITENKTDDTFLISPCDAPEETAEQIGYKAREAVTRKLRASKCEVNPVPKETALDFFIRNHRQTAPHITRAAVYLGLVYKSELVAVMGYDQSSGAVRGVKEGYELVRLAISRETQIHGGASKLQKACEDVLRRMGVYDIFSYSNATINTGAVYEKLGFHRDRIDGGQPFVICENNEITRLINLYPNSTDKILAAKGRLKTHLGGNIMWTKNIREAEACQETE